MKLKKIVKYAQKNCERLADESELKGLALFCCKYQKGCSLTEWENRLSFIVNFNSFKAAYEEMESIISRNESDNNYLAAQNTKTYVELSQMHILYFKNKAQMKQRRQKVVQIKEADISHRKLTSACFINGMLVVGRTYKEIYEEFENSR